MCVDISGNQVFYKDKKGDVLVKVLHNEREVHIPVNTDMWPYYRWSDVRAYYVTVLDSDPS